MVPAASREPGAMTTGTGMKRITIISPCYNEGTNVRVCYEAIRSLFDGPLAGYEREHIFADNASTDGTVAVLREIAGNDPHLRIIVNARNVGVLRSTFNALKASSGDATLVMMAVDLQDPPELIAQFVRHWEAGHKVVQGVRVKRDEGLIMRTTRWAYYRLVRRLTPFEIPADVGEFQLLDRQVVDAVTAFDDHDPYIRGLIAYVGFKPYGIPYVWRARRRGVSKNRLLTLVDIALNGLLSFTKTPLRVLSAAGLVMAVLSLLYAIGNLLWLLTRQERPVQPGIPTLIVALFFFSGVQLLFLGLLGEYIVSIHQQVRFGGRVIEAERINFDRSTRA